MILGLDRPTAGTALVNGKPYAELTHPLRTVGALLDARAVHPGRSARNHLRAMARSNGIPEKRVGEVLEAVGLSQVAGKRAGGFSLGMSQRLGVAEATKSGRALTSRAQTQWGRPRQAKDDFRHVAAPAL